MKTISTTIILFTIILFNLNLKANNPAIPKGIVYQLTVKSTDIAKSKKVITEYHYLRKVMTQGKFEYQFGKYTSYKEAEAAKSSLIRVGCSDVGILAYNNHILIPLTVAISIQYKADYLKERKTEKKLAKSITTNEVNYLLQVQQSGLKHYYSLAIPVTSIETVDLILEEIDDEQVIEISIDNNLYSIGKYSSFQEVIAARKQFIESEIFDVFIMAQITDDRINNEDTNNLALTIQNVVNELAAK
ncbi:MAG: hypothetical protein COB15_08980 [Flavobacteriales bacterium]|nr:MAG: hypothetical protein COB15_08980 [Flavobacteriales bacterium]